MWVFFGDDATQRKPSRQRMKPVCAIGVIGVHCDKLRALEHGLDDLCSSVGFKPTDKFKWSPGKNDWMYDKLKDTARERFFCGALDLAKTHGCVAFVMTSEIRFVTATDKAKSAQDDVLVMTLERVGKFLQTKNDDGLLLMDRPSGGSMNDDEKFLADCAVKLLEGTRYVRPDRLALNVLTSLSSNVRCLQLADLVVSCTAARVAGSPHSTVKAVFPSVLPLLHRNLGRVHGYGIKLHPDHRNTNLYKWLFDETHFWSGNVGRPLPLSTRPYALSEDVF